MISIAEAQDVVRQNTARLETEDVWLNKAVGRILAQDIFADSDLPPFDRAQMDGYAVRAEDVKDVPAKLRLVGESAAGAGWNQPLKAGEAVRIMTGAPVPVGANAVQRVEVTREENGFVQISESVAESQFVTQRASEITRGARVFAKGERVTAAMIASLASFGYSQVQVGKRPRVFIASTGNEIVEVDRQPGRDEIRNSNTATLAAYAELAGAEVQTLPIITDEISNLKSQISNAVENCDCLVLTGGVSMGIYDFTKTALRELGAGILFEKVALRPGKPTVFAKLNDKSVFGLPGNPVSAAVTFNLFVRTALLQMQGAIDCELKTSWAVLTKRTTGASERDSLLPAGLSTDERGRLLAEPLKWGGSSDFVAFARADALVCIPPGATLESEAVVKILHLP